jgi:hypothetical protein
MKSPDCPYCGNPPLYVMEGGGQAFCGCDDCPCICWNPNETPAHQRAHENVIDVRDMTTPQRSPE